ncbi:unnamed protein product [Cylicocyclus nassatus]|uniref:Uncharacterized protein n=1 Tax=Cylicocyclus nassatus TaxID=53992 RepID=A0AA36HGS4_CYLNA|nr:unnamed protein product [Cylicocyclus nassatus]
MTEYVQDVSFKKCVLRMRTRNKQKIKDDEALLSLLSTITHSVLEMSASSSATNSKQRLKAAQTQQTQAEKDFENCEDCRRANKHAVPPMYFTCPKHVMVLVCPICMDHKCNYHSPQNCPALRNGKVPAKNPEVIFVHKELKRN